MLLNKPNNRHLSLGGGRTFKTMNYCAPPKDLVLGLFNNTSSVANARHIHELELSENVACK